MIAFHLIAISLFPEVTDLYGSLFFVIRIICCHINVTALTSKVSLHLFKSLHRFLMRRFIQRQLRNDSDCNNEERFRDMQSES